MAVRWLLRAGVPHHLHHVRPGLLVSPRVAHASGATFSQLHPELRYSSRSKILFLNAPAAPRSWSREVPSEPPGSARHPRILGSLPRCRCSGPRSPPHHLPTTLQLDSSHGFDRRDSAGLLPGVQVRRCRREHQPRKVRVQGSVLISSCAPSFRTAPYLNLRALCMCLMPVPHFPCPYAMLPRSIHPPRIPTGTYTY